MGNNNSQSGSNDGEFRQRPRSALRQNSSGSEDTLIRQPAYRRQSQYGSHGKLSTIKPSDPELVYEDHKLRKSKSAKSKPILRPQSAPQAGTHLDDMLNEEEPKSSKQKLQSSSGAVHKSHYHFKRKHRKQKGTNTDTEEEESSSDDNEERERPVSRQSKPGVPAKSKTYVQETDLDDQKITVEVKVTSAPKEEEPETNNKETPEKSSKDHHHHHRSHGHKADKEKKAHKAAVSESSASEEHSSEEEADSESEESSAETEGTAEPPEDPTVSSKLLDVIKKDMTFLMVQEQRKALLKTDPVLQILDRANTNELILTNLPLSTTIADVHQVFHTAVGIRLGVESLKRESKLAKIAFDSKNEALDAYVLGRHKKVNGSEVIIGIRRDDSHHNGKKTAERKSKGKDEASAEPEEADSPPSEKVDKDDLVRNWVKFQEETYEPSVKIKPKKSPKKKTNK